jgi:hypothetical protein
MRSVIIFALLFASPLMGLHVCARIYAEAQERADDCKSKSYPGTRSDSTSPIGVAQRQLLDTRP